MIFYISKFQPLGVISN